MSLSETFDVVILGSGHRRLAACLASGASPGKKVAVVERQGRRLLPGRGMSALQERIVEREGGRCR